MLKSVRVPEKAYAIVLWVVSVVFAGFIIGLGNLVIGDLPHVEQRLDLLDFYPASEYQAVTAQRRRVMAQIEALGVRQQVAKLQLVQARHDSSAQFDTLQAWIETRSAIADSGHDPELITRTNRLEALKASEQAAQAKVDTLDQQEATLQREFSGVRAHEQQIYDAAQPAYERAQFWQELRVFLFRLAITLPMLLVAAWLVVRKRGSDYWPLARGFVLAAVFVFFVELVPYLPSYGGYVRYGVGIVLTFAAGMFLIRNMRAYLARRQAVEAQAETERRKLVSHDEAFRKMAAKQCPGCDRPIASMEGSESNFCVHCGMTLYDHCLSCHTRKMAFFRYCMACGTPAQTLAEAPPLENSPPPA